MSDWITVPGKEECPGYLTWSAFGATYPDTVCASALDWGDLPYPGETLCDADDEFRPKDIPCPFCDPKNFILFEWGESNEYEVRWSTDHALALGAEIHFHDGEALWWTATHPTRGEERVLIHQVEPADA